jgi:hypothetical protein
MDRGGKLLIMMMMMSMIRGGKKSRETTERTWLWRESWEEDKINSNSSTGATAEILIAVELLVINAGNRTLLIITKESSKLELKSIDLLHLCVCVCVCVGAVCSVQQQQQQQQFH